ncbi:MAG: hypothetical protein I3273_00220 [Candidatus Moeniiplasma glomeromycotorum]|nr:hypothetical protein [Candidatus Moeniiplasma glomeromycotorum]MCE8167446.1 hypothetical protein [Candidatus Moeniiplasma glomeromycotorum]MCE8168540.1 hypothetical protein [Candidatus Moeniiplasma glomeromycotorum]
MNKSSELYSQLQGKYQELERKYDLLKINIGKHQETEAFNELLKEENKELKDKISKLEQQPTQESYNQLKNNQKPINLPNDWEKQLERIPKLEAEVINNLMQVKQLISEKNNEYQQKQASHQKTFNQLKEEKQNWQQREKELLTEIELLKTNSELHEQLQNKYQELKKEYNLLNDKYRQTQESYNQLKNNQKPVDLPDDWENQLKRIPILEAEISALTIVDNGRNKETIRWLNRLAESVNVPWFILKEEIKELKITAQEQKVQVLVSVIKIIEKSQQNNEEANEKVAEAEKKLQSVREELTKKQYNQLKEMREMEAHIEATLPGSWNWSW